MYDCRTETLGVKDIGVLTRNEGNRALEAIDNAINIVSGCRAKAGAQQNRLEHTMKYLAAAEQNLTVAESRIRDADMAKELTALSKSNVLTNAAQAMLAQANINAQSALRLLG